MKSFLAILAIVTAFAACKKERDHSSITALNGQWKMIKVMESPNGAAVTKPSPINGDVVLTITLQTDMSGTITGNTPSNTLSGGFTLFPANGIRIPAVAASKVAETFWGGLFMDNITTAQSYSTSCNELQINTAQKTLFFQKQ
jgi:heat shock protein HslJ